MHWFLHFKMDHDDMGTSVYEVVKNINLYPTVTSVISKILLIKIVIQREYIPNNIIISFRSVLEIVLFSKCMALMKIWHFAR